MKFKSLAQRRALFAKLKSQGYERLHGKIIYPSREYKGGVDSGSWKVKKVGGVWFAKPHILGAKD